MPPGRVWSFSGLEKQILEKGLTHLPTGGRATGGLASVVPLPQLPFLSSPFVMLVKCEHFSTVLGTSVCVS